MALITSFWRKRIGNYNALRGTPKTELVFPADTIKRNPSVPPELVGKTTNGRAVNKGYLAALKNHAIEQSPLVVLQSIV